VLDRYGAAIKERRIVIGSGDPGQHVLAGDLMSAGTTDAVVDMILEFLERAHGSPGGDD
jgi:hypothetical protein